MSNNQNEMDIVSVVVFNTQVKWLYMVIKVRARTIKPAKAC